MGKHEFKPFDLTDSKERDRVYKMYTDEQLLLYHAIEDKIYTVCNAKTGTGKTTVALHAGLNLLSSFTVKQLVYLRIPSDRDLKLGYLPGTLEEKCYTLWQPFYDAMLTLGIPEYALGSLIGTNQIVLTTDIGLRGCNMDKVVCITDEAQCLPDDDTLKLILTRFHDNCHVVVLGDILQNDNKRKSKVFQEYAIDYMSKPKYSTYVELTKNFRGQFSQYAETYGGDK